MKSNNYFARLYRFVKHTRFWPQVFAALFLSAYYRLCVLYVKPDKMRKNWGAENEVSQPTETKEHYRYAYKVACAVESVCARTSWESKCLVRALTAQYLLTKNNITSTLYLGCKMEDEKMVAHAWIRCGEMYVTGGNGEGYSVSYIRTILWRSELLLRRGY